MTSSLRLAVLAALAAGAASAQTAPVWANLAECSAVFAAVARTDTGGAQSADLARADQAAARFRAAAVIKAAEAGEPDPKAAVASIMGYLTERWTNRASNILSLRSNLRWIDYCRALGTAEGVLPLPG